MTPALLGEYILSVGISLTIVFIIVIVALRWFDIID